MPNLQSFPPPSDSFFFDRFGRKAFSRRTALWEVGMILIVIVFGALFVGWWRAPQEFPVKAYLTIEQGETLSSIASRLAAQALIRSPVWFKIWSTLFSGTRGIKAGDYFFSEPISVVRLSARLTEGDYELSSVRITIPEGTNNKQIARILKKSLPRFNETKFLHLAKDKEGYLFPDTYLFFLNMTEEAVIAAMEATFVKRVEPMHTRIEQFGKPLAEILHMAAILEEEARTTETRKKIAGILWKRLKQNMPLQVDAVFPYIFGDRPYDLTDGDLLVDSPYNTYKYAGFPPTPISNPGLAAIRAAITPITTPYWYYLSDREGNMHYAVTHDEHLANREQYLNK